jgi:hypothetical protein
MRETAKYGYCRICGAELKCKTKSGLCDSCRIAVLVENIRQLREKQGEFYEKWKRGMVRYAEKLLSNGKPKKHRKR